MKQRYVLIKCVEGTVRLNADQIVMVESCKHRNTIITENGEYHIYCKLDDIQLLLEKYGFVRAHKSYLVNVRYMKSICNYKLTLNNGDVLNIPRKRYTYVKSLFDENGT